MGFRPGIQRFSGTQAKMWWLPWSFPLSHPSWHWRLEQRLLPAERKISGSNRWTMTTTSLFLSPKLFLSISKPKPYNSVNTHNSSLPFTSTTTKNTILLHNTPHRITQKSTQLWRISSASEGEVVLPSEATLLENSQEIVSTSDDSVSTIISTLLFIAFIGLSILTIGVKSLYKKVPFFHV